MNAKLPPQELTTVCGTDRSAGLAATGLRSLVSQMPHATLQELAAEWKRRRTAQVCTATVRRALRAQGIVRLKPKLRAFDAVASSALKPYGYRDMHRRDAGLHYRTDLTSAEWQLIADLLESPMGQRATPARYERRHLVNACGYVLRMGCAWRLLPPSFAPGHAVYKAFARWAEADTSERMQTPTTSSGVCAGAVVLSLRQP